MPGITAALARGDEENTKYKGRKEGKERGKGERRV
jgi:hypothetical protein